MASFQDVRGAMAKLVSGALVSGGIPFEDQVFDNVQDTPPRDGCAAYARILISFPQTVIDTMNDGGADRIVASCNVLLYTPKGKGMKPAEDMAQLVIQAWTALNYPSRSTDTVRLKTWNISGPNCLAPDQRPHQVTQLSCAFKGSPV